MSVRALVSVDEYLNTSYGPDMEYVDGVLMERHGGDWLHALVQANLIAAFSIRYPDVFAVPELRSKTRETRYRLPDVCVLLTPPATKYLVDAAFLVIEILSEDDSMSRTMEKLEEYRQHGVPNIWLIDPRLRTISAYIGGDVRENRSDVVATSEPRLELTRAEIFRRLP
jgi:Uma2 family endonuclease